jgi:tetratricopeptide (TPR) repeat protein
MPDIDPNKTVFISYRRHVSKYLARAVFLDLRQHGYDVFLDIETINSGDWEAFILNQIGARTHFLLLLTPGTLDRCVDANDMVRREIEYAMSLGRNIVPVLVDEFKFNTVEHYLVGKLSALPQFNALRLPDEYFDEAMSRLRNRFLKTPVYQPTIQAVTLAEETKAEAMIDHVTSQPIPTKDELSAEILFYRALEKRRIKDFEGAIADYSEAIQLNSQFGSAYNNRGAIRSQMGQFDEAIADFGIFIQLHPDNPDGYYNRGFNRAEKGDLVGAISDYSQSLRLNPTDTEALVNRAEDYFQVGEYAKALADFGQLNKFNKDEPASPAGLAITEYQLGNTEAARRIWQGLVEQNTHYKDAEWVGKELNWAEPLVEAVRKLVSELV